MVIEKQNDNKRKDDDSSRNNQQQQPHKKQNVAREYTAGPGEKKAYTGNLPLCTKCNYHHTRQCAPKCNNCKNGAQGKAYVLGGGDSNPETNTVTGTFLLNNRYALILFDTGADRSFEPEPEDEDTKEDELSDGSDKTELFEEDKTAITSPSPRHYGARISVKPQTPIAASTQALIDAFASGSPLFLLTPTSPAYDQGPLGNKTAMICRIDDILEEDMRGFVFTAPPPRCDVADSSVAAARAPRGQYDFVDTVEAGQCLIRSPNHDVWTIAKATDIAEDVGYVRALHASKHRMMTSIKEVNLRISYQAQVRRQESKYFYRQIHDAQTDLRDIRLKIDVRQSAKDLAVNQMMRIYALESRARTDTVEDASSSC
nr:reverse transcriptase domain-containing protein [Tanacetum cinerariifolium]